MRCATFHACLFSTSDRNTYALDESHCFDYIAEKPRTPVIGAPCWDKDGAGSGISDQ